MHYTILFRGSLSSCNFDCHYCPFAKRRETQAELAADQTSLNRFVQWAQSQESAGHLLSILFTPWGEALTRKWYQQAMATLTNSNHIRKVAIQTNLSCKLDWLSECDRTKLGLWCSYHPSEITRNAFLNRCRVLDELKVRYSVGIVGLKENLSEAYSIRQLLSPDVYLWVNAFKRNERYYSDAETNAFSILDPLFNINNTRHPSFGKPCRTGETVFSVDGSGTMRRCHFIDKPIGNIYAENWELSLSPKPCTNISCGCHIGYVHMPELGLYEIFGSGVLERIPHLPIWKPAPPPPSANL